MQPSSSKAVSSGLKSVDVYDTPAKLVLFVAAEAWIYDRTPTSFKGARTPLCKHGLGNKPAVLNLSSVLCRSLGHPLAHCRMPKNAELFRASSENEECWRKDCKACACSPPCRLHCAINLGGGGGGGGGVGRGNGAIAGAKK